MNRRSRLGLQFHSPRGVLVMQFIMVPLMIGLWEMGRVVQVQQIVANAAREGARMAAQANTINQTGTPLRS